MKLLIILILGFVTLFVITPHADAKSYIKSYKRSSGATVRSYTRYKADGYKFNNYQYRPDRGYNR